MRLIPNWLQRLKGAPAAAPRRLAYKPGLIAELEAEHADLLEKLAALVRSHRRGDHAAAMQDLQRFTRVLRAHLLKENLHLYDYLGQQARGDDACAELVRSMRAEMGAIGRVLGEFVARHVDRPWTAQTHGELRTQLDAVERLLRERIACEEAALYPLYAPPAEPTR